MEIIGIVILLGLFALGVGFVYLFLQYIELLKSVKNITETISARLQNLEEKMGGRSPREPAPIARSEESKQA